MRQLHAKQDILERLIEVELELSNIIHTPAFVLARHQVLIPVELTLFDRMQALVRAEMHNSMMIPYKYKK